MTQTMQSGAHPDAEALTAFAEQMLSDAERASVLAHMAECGRCREVVFLAQQASSDPVPVPNKAPEVPQKKTAAGWLTIWRWSWIPIAALAGVVGIAVLRHDRHADLSHEQMAQNVSPPEHMENEAKSKDSISPRKQQPVSNMERQKGNNEPTERDKKESARVLDRNDKAVAQKKNDQFVKDTDLPGTFGSGAGGAVAEAAKPADSASTISQNQVSMARNAPPEQQGNSAEQRKLKGSLDASTKPSPAGIQMPRASESVSVQAADTLAPSSAAPGSPPQLAADSSQMTLSGKNLSKAARSKLPGGLEVLSEASEAQKRVALDTTGSLFFSEDDGKHWHAVKPFWTGRAVSVSTRPIAGHTSANALAQPTTLFVLSTSEEQKWISSDGQNWSPEPQADN